MMQNHSGVSRTPGSLVYGSTLRFHNVNWSATGSYAGGGSWRVMGHYLGSGTGTTNAISVCVRIS